MLTYRSASASHLFPTRILQVPSVAYLSTFDRIAALATTREIPVQLSFANARFDSLAYSNDESQPMLHSFLRGRRSETQQIL